MKKVLQESRMEIKNAADVKITCIVPLDITKV